MANMHLDANSQPHWRNRILLPSPAAVMLVEKNHEWSRIRPGLRECFARSLHRDLTGPLREMPVFSEKLRALGPQIE
ncbi:MAG: hypothetical protein K2P94_14505 [Rhodospirillaceae bacterium]|nr:hypothetical protein [Rhodospirillaceae bacterium]